MTTPDTPSLDMETRRIPSAWRVRLIRPVLLAALALSIPAFYLVLTVTESGFDNLGRILYGVVAGIVLLDLLVQLHADGRWFGAWRNAHRYLPEMLILTGALVSAWRADAPWSQTEWLIRLAYCGLVFVRLSLLLSHLLASNRLSQVLWLGCMGWLFAGAGFFWMEPKVHSLADGMWLAFTTISTVGYGDLVPSTPAARVFAVFVVLLGYALFSIITASIAALFVGEDEKRLERELHADIRALREEVAALRADLKQQQKI